MAGLISDATATEQTALEPPPFTEPLHCVTVASVVVSSGSHTKRAKPL
jgi:hypothetical protein